MRRSWTYRERLVREGLALAACGVVGSAALLALVDGTTDGPASTVGQELVVLALLLALGPRAVKKWVADAEPIPPAIAPPGEPTPLWHLPLVVAGLTAIFWPLLDAPDAGLRITLGCTLVGLAQALLLAPLVARAETRRGALLYRLPGSRIGRGTRLGLRPRPEPE